MNIFIKSIICIFSALIVYIILQQQGKDFSIILTLAVCIMIAVAVLQQLRQLSELLNQLLILSKIDNKMVQILLKAVGISLLTEISAAICNDAGNAALGKMLVLLGSIAILLTSIPLFTGLIDFINSILFST